MSLAWNLVEPGHGNGRGLQFLFIQQAHCAGPYLSSPEDDPILVLRSVVLVILQLLPLDAHRHGPQLFIHTEVIGMLCKGRPGKYGQMSRRRGHRPQQSGAVGG